jgi:hypothetical protein
MERYTLRSGKVPKDITISCGSNQHINFRIVTGSNEILNGRAH